MTPSASSVMSERSAVRGAERPRICHFPEYSDSAGDEAVKLAALAGLNLDDWQQFVLRHALGERQDGKWAAPTVGLCVGRQNGKGSILEARELAGLFLFGEKVLVHTAHLQKTSTAHFQRVLSLIESVPEFDRRVLSAPTGKGSEAIKLRGGQVIYFATRAGGGGRGLTIDFLAYDEAMFLTENDRSSMTPAMAARSMAGNIQTWYVGSAVDQMDPSQDGIPFSQIRRSGMSGKSRVAYFEFSAPGDDPARVPDSIASDPSIWALANPGLGIRISLDHVEQERTVEMSARGFAVERLGIGDWPDPTEEEGRVISAATWKRLEETDQSKRVTSRETFAVDTDTNQTWGSVGVAGQRDDGLWQVHVVKHARGKDWIVDCCEQLRRDHPEARFVIDPRGPAASLISDLKAVGIEPVEVTAQDYATAFADFVSAAHENKLRYPAPAPDLTDAVTDARKAPLGDRWKWGRRNSTSADISPVVACTLALWGAKNAESEYATLIFAASDEHPETDPEIGPSYRHVGPVEPRVIGQDEYTTCFACRVGGCTVHGDEGGLDAI